jgi:hypothetical protein
MAGPPVSAATAASAARSRPETATHAPRRARAAAEAAPIPLDPPVTRILRPVRSLPMSASGAARTRTARGSATFTVAQLPTAARSDCRREPVVASTALGS